MNSENSPAEGQGPTADAEQHSSRAVNRRARRHRRAKRAGASFLALSTGAAGFGLGAKLLAVGVVAAVGAGVLTSDLPDASGPGSGGAARLKPQREKSVPVVPVKAFKRLSKDETGDNPITALPKPEWPRARTTTVALPDPAGRSAKAAADGVPVRVGHGKPGDAARGTSQGAGTGMERLTVRMGDRKEAASLAVDGVVFTLSDPDGRGGPVDVELDYSSFATAYGASWASRLYLIELPACALTTPEKAKCRKSTRVERGNNTKDHTLTGQVVVRGDGQAAGAEDPPAEEPDETTAPPTSEPPADEPEEPRDESPGEPKESDGPSDGSESSSGEGSDASGGGSAAQSSTPSPTVLAVAAGAKSENGDFGVSDLSPAGSWSGGGSSGDFSYSYPMGAPAVPGGLAPEMSLSYNSGSVDGKTASTNSQTSWVGDGWDLAPGGYIERTYRSCAEDTGGNEPDDSADLCWYRDSMSIMVGGVSGELIKDASGEWVATADSGAKIEKISGTSTGNGAPDGEYWKVTTTDGTQYFLGRNKLPGWSSHDPATSSDDDPETNSVNTVPVFGNDSGEPCHATAFKDSWCDQAWRWNVDLVIDPLGNAMSFYYVHEKNDYTVADVEGEKADYVRGAYLDRIEYGLRESALYSTPTAKVDFDVAERCIPTGSFTCDPVNRTKDNAQYWPDTPVDLECRNGPNTNCQAQWHQDGASGWWEPGSHSPTFFSTRRLTKVTTKIYSGGWSTVDSWELAQSFPGTGDGLSPALWLKSVQRTGYAGTGDPIATPTVKFEGAVFANRVDLTTDRPYYRYRVVGIDNGHGGFTGIKYRDAECHSGMTLPAPHENTLACFPIKWKPYNGYDDPITDWFHKYVVAEVVEQDLTGSHLEDDVLQADPVHTRYEYVGDAAWAWDTNDAVKGSDRTWSVWRGYGKVRTLVGDPNRVEQIVTEAIFARGMDGDRLPSGSRSVTVSTSGGAVEDHRAWAGLTLEERKLLDGVTAETTLTDPWRSTATATATRDDETTARAYRTGVKGTKARAKAANGSWRYTESRSSLNSLGLPLWTEQLGEVSSWGGTARGDVTCTKVDYVDNTTKHILGSVVEKTHFEGHCSSTASENNVIGAEKLYYDNGAFGAAPTKGLLTKADVLKKWTAAGKEWTATKAEYDQFGRQTKGIDALNGASTTAYTPATGAVTKVTNTNPLFHTASATMDPKRGQPLSVTDAAGYTSQAESDTLGRTTKVWGPGRAKTFSPDAQFAYDYNTDAPNWVKTQKRRDDGAYDTSYTLLDGLLRERQTQAPGLTGGRIINDKIYDTRGLVKRTYGPYWNSSATGTDLVSARTAQIPAHTLHDFDTMGREVKSTFARFAEPEWSSETLFLGADFVVQIPPEGATATGTVTDGFGRVVEKRQYETFAAARAGSNAAADFKATRYDHTAGGELASVVDPGGAKWSFEYDLAGNKTKVSDPDAGVSTSTYDDAGQLKSATDARGKTLAYVYDKIGRNTEVWRDTPVDPPGKLLIKNVFDTLKKGLPTSSTRYVGVYGYKTETKGYDSFGRVTGSKVTIPSAEGALAGVYAYSTTSFTPATGLPRVEEVPTAGGLPNEAIHREYTAAGLPLKSYAQTVGTTTTREFVSDTTYTPYGEVDILTRGSADTSDSIKNVQTQNFYQEGTRRVYRTLVARDSSVQSVVADRIYSHDDAGNITRISDEPVGGPQDVQCFDHDWLGRLAEAWTPASGDCGAARSVANLGGAAPYWLKWQFDAQGNRETEVEQSSAGTTTRTFTQPDVDASGLGQPHTTRSMVETLPSGSQVHSTYDYDDAGNTESRQIDGDTQTLTWDDFGRAETITEADGKKTEYLYGPDGERLIVRDPQATTLYLPGMELRLPKGSSTAQGVRYYDHGGSAVAQWGAQGQFWLLGDHQGTGAISMGVSDLAVTRRYQTPYGGPRGTNPPLPFAGWPNSKGFVGGTIDTVADLTHIGARHYDAALGQFISIDPLIDYTDPVQMHGYGYANWSPITHSDRTGLIIGLDALVVANSVSSNSPSALVGNIINGDYQSAEVNPKFDYLCAGPVCVSTPKPPPPPDPYAKCNDNWAPGLCRATNELDTWLDRNAPSVIAEPVAAFEACEERGECVALGTEAAIGRVLAVAKWFKFGDDLNDGRKGSNAHCPRSFPPGTKVVMADGTTKPIEDIELGDKVLAADPETGKTRPREVTATWISSGLKTLVDVTAEKKQTSAGARPAGVVGKTLTVSGNHLFWTADRKRWVRADQLGVGDRLQTSDGARIQISALRTRAATHHRVHNLTIADLHTYHVRVGATDALVHNCPDAKIPLLGSRATRRKAMREFGIPTSAQPIETLTSRAGKQYIYEVPTKGGGRGLVAVTDQTTDRVAGHTTHWEVGWVKPKVRDGFDRYRVYNKGKVNMNYAP